MAEANADFENLHNSRTQESATVEVSAVIEARAEAKTAFNDFIRSLNSHADLNNSEEFQALEEEINYEVKQAKSSLHLEREDNPTEDDPKP